MKRILLILLLVSVAVIVIAAPTETHTSRSPIAGQHAGERAFKKCTITATDVNNFTESLDVIYGVVMRVAINNTGADANFAVTLLDENDIEIFTKTGIDGDPDTTNYGYAVYEDDTEGNPWMGVPVAGSMSLVVADANDASMTSLSVSIYYFSFWD